MEVDLSATPPCPDGRHRRREDRGASFNEILISIVLLGMLIVPIATAMTTAVTASSRNFEAAEVQTAIVNAADRVNRAPMSCDYTIYVQAAVLTEGWDAGQATVSHQRYVPGANPTQPGTWVPGACQNVAPTAETVQLLTIRITSPGGKISRQIEVVKSNV